MCDTISVSLQRVEVLNSHCLATKPFEPSFRVAFIFYILQVNLLSVRIDWEWHVSGRNWRTVGRIISKVFCFICTENRRLGFDVAWWMEK